MNSNLEKFTHIFLHQDTPRKALEPPYSSPYQVLSQREKTATPHVQEACHCVNRQGQAGLHPQRDWPWEQLQPASCNNPGHSTTCHAATALHNDYTLWSPQPFPCLLKHLSTHLHGGVDVGTSRTVKQTTPTVKQEQVIFICYSLQCGCQDTHTSATQPALIAETPVLTGYRAA
jgi:hypothetical protein